MTLDETDDNYAEEFSRLRQRIKCKIEEGGEHTFASLKKMVDHPDLYTLVEGLVLNGEVRNIGTDRYHRLVRV